MSGPITIGAPPIGGGNYDHEIRQLSQQLQALQRVMDGMSPQTIVDAEGTAYDIIGRYMGPRDIGSERLPFEIFTRGNAIVAHPGIVGFQPFPEQIVANPANGSWYFQARVEVDPDTGVTTYMTAEWTLTPSNSTGISHSRIIARIVVSNGAPNPASIEQYTYGPIVVVTYGGVNEKWNILTY